MQYLMNSPTDSAPPVSQSSNDREAWLRLAFVALPAARVQLALELWQTPEALLGAAQGESEELLKTPGLTANSVQRLREAAEMNVDKALTAMERKEIRLLLQDDAEYPAALRGIEAPPPYLFIRGEITPADEVAIAIVGTRHATEYGRGAAESFAAAFAQRGVTVVSGLARGIDTAAHRGALDAHGRTFAVCGCGLDIVYPTENKSLMDEIVANGANISEFAPTTHPESWHFPARNRIISGLCAGVVVVEAGERSGALITSDFAMDQGREVFAVPGNIHKAQSRGPHALIKAGATLVENADDVIAALNNRALPFESETAQRTARSRKEKERVGPPMPRADLSLDENRVWLQLEEDPIHVDELAAKAQMGAAEVNGTLVLLELKGFARRLPGGMFAKVAQ